MLKGPDTDTNLHVLPPGTPEAERTLRFRDRLRASEADRELYERTKRQLAARNWTYVLQYSDAKTEVIEKILARSQQNTLTECQWARRGLALSSSIAADETAGSVLPERSMRQRGLTGA